MKSIMNGKLKILITGGLGNLGSWLSYHFSEDYEVYILSKNSNIELDCEYTLIKSDITDIIDLRKKLNFKIDYCIHTASYNEFFYDNYAKDALLINSLGTRNIVEVLKDKNIKNFIYLSTFHVYGKNEGTIDEQTQLEPLNDYASTHLFAEYYIKQYFKTDNFPFVIFRLSNSYGCPKYYNSSKWYLVLNDLVKSSFEKNKIILKSNGLGKRDFISMKDVCESVEKSLNINSSLDNIFNLSSSISFNMIEIAKKVQSIYFERYKKEIEIIINTKDTSTSKYLKVCNQKLLNTIDMNFKDDFELEINKIFDLLENN